MALLNDLWVDRAANRSLGHATEDSDAPVVNSDGGVSRSRNECVELDGVYPCVQEAPRLAPGASAEKKEVARKATRLRFTRSPCGLTTRASAAVA